MNFFWTCKSSVPFHRHLTKVTITRKVCAGISISLLTSSAILLYFLYISITEEMYFHKHYLDFLHENPMTSQSCHLPKLEPWDPTAIKYYRKTPTLKCGFLQPYLTQVTVAGLLQWNGSEENHVTYSLLDCFYQEFLRSPNDDDTIYFDPPIEFFGSAQLKSQYANISCFHQRQLYYYNIHIWIPQELLGNTTSKSPSKLLPNVFVLGIDSMSHSNFIRQLPLTYEAIAKEFSSVVMKGLIKVGDNTFPNMVPLLSGQRAYENDFPPRTNGKYYDSWPLIWKNFSSAGYLTIYQEDLPKASCFNYLDKGFLSPPTHLYPRPFWILVEAKHGPISHLNKEFCFGNVAKHVLFFSYLRKAIEAATKTARPYFVFSFLTEFSHDDLNQPQVVDDELVLFLRWLHSHNSSRNTIVFVLGDHGIRFGKFRQTQLGRVEETMPFLSIWVPPHINEKIPQLDTNLRTNSQRLASWFDVYDTLMDIATFQIDKMTESNHLDRFDQRPARSREEIRKEDRQILDDSLDRKNANRQEVNQRHQRHPWSRFGHSLWYPLPTDRSCEDAGIPQNYCPCESEIAMATNEGGIVDEAASSLFRHLNSELSEYPQCAQLELRAIRSAIKVLPNRSVARVKGFQVVLRMVVEATPNHAVFEATMKSEVWSSGFVPVGIVSRLDAYGNTSSCISDKIRQLYCYCQD